MLHFWNSEETYQSKLHVKYHERRVRLSRGGKENIREQHMQKYGGILKVCYFLGLATNLILMQHTLESEVKRKKSIDF